MRVCSNCKCEKPLEKFPNDKSRSLGKANRCIPCKRADDERCRLKREYNITPCQVEEMFKSQNGQCCICYRDLNNHRQAIDHSHVSGKVRGLLCNSCNTGLGKFNDDPIILERAAQYLRDKI